MLEAFLVISVLCIIDLILLIIMPTFYFKIGIPIYKRSTALSKELPLRDLGNMKMKSGRRSKLIY